jgi:hypothetical protein
MSRREDKAREGVSRFLSRAVTLGFPRVSGYCHEMSRGLSRDFFLVDKKACHADCHVFFASQSYSTTLNHMPDFFGLHACHEMSRCLIF